MNEEAIFHVNMENFVYPIARNELVFQIRVAKQDIAACDIVYWNRDDGIKKCERLGCAIRDKLYDYYRGKVKFKQVARYQKYYFILKDTVGHQQYYSTIGITDYEPTEYAFEYLYANGNDVIHYPDWTKGTVYYQIFPERFFNGDTANDPKECMKWGTAPTRENYMGGDLKGIQMKIPYLKELGIECIYLNPIFCSDFNHKYATSNYFKVDPIFGTNEDFRELVDKCHDNGIKVVLDGVFNHTGIHISFFEDLLENQSNSKYAKWYLTEKEKIDVSEKDYECVGAYKWMPKLNTANKEVREFVIKVMDYWISEYQIDGWRLDVADEVDSTVWQMARRVLKDRYPEIILIGETWGYGGTLVTANRLDSVMNYMFRDAVWDYFGKNRIDVEEFDQRINHMLAMYKEETMQVMYNLIDSHDTERFLYICKENKELYKLAIAFQILFIGSPAIYYGDEVGQTGANDPDCRRCMIWDETADVHLKKYYQQYIDIRRRHDCIRRGTFRTVLADNRTDTYAFVRSSDMEDLYVLIHKGGIEESIKCPVLQQGEYEDCITHHKYVVGPKEKEMYNGDIAEYQGVIPVNMPAYSVKVISHLKEEN